MMMVPTPSTNETYGMVIQDEIQRGKTVTAQPLEIGAHTIAYNSGQGSGGSYSQGFGGGHSQDLEDYRGQNQRTTDVIFVRRRAILGTLVGNWWDI